MNEDRADLETARQLDRDDPLSRFRDEFLIPTRDDDTEEIYLCGHSLGLQPRRTRIFLDEELDAWEHLAVKGHFEATHPWLPYHRALATPMAAIVGALPSEVVVMNTLTVNLHLLMVSFYRPTTERHRILIEGHAFPSDHYAVSSQIRFHGFDLDDSLLIVRPRNGEETIRLEDLAGVIEAQGDTIALILLPGIQYYTGQAFDMAEIVRMGHRRGCVVGFDLAHAAGNLEMHLHDWDADFAAWCTYKYLNAGPGSVGAAFVHERHANRFDLPRLAGWWGHDEASRFHMGPHFQPMSGAEGWQISNPPILSLAAIRASLDVFSEAGGMAALRARGIRMTGYLESLLRKELAGLVRIITPEDPIQRGSQLSLEIRSERLQPREVFQRLIDSGITPDWREPNVIRVTPIPLYNRYEEIWRFVEELAKTVDRRA